MRNSVRCFLAIADDAGGGRVISFRKRRFIIVRGIAAIAFALTQELEVRGVAVRGVYVSTS